MWRTIFLKSLCTGNTHPKKNSEGPHIFEAQNQVTVATPALSCDGHVQTKSEGGCEWSGWIKLVWDWLGVVQRPVYRRLSPKSVVTVEIFKLTLAYNTPERKVMPSSWAIFRFLQYFASTWARSGCTRHASCVDSKPKKTKKRQELRNLLAVSVNLLRFAVTVSSPARLVGALVRV